MNWFLLSLISIIALAVGDLVQQYILNEDNDIDERTSGVLTFGLQALCTLPIILFSNFRYQFFDIFEASVFPYLLLTTFTASIGMIFFLKSFKVKNISISSIFVSFSVVISTILGILVFKESIYPLKILGIILIIGAIISLNINNLKLEKNHWYGLLAGIFFGVTYVFDKLVVTTVHPLIYLFWSFALISILSFLIKPSSIINTLKKAKMNAYKAIAVSGIGYFIYNFCTFTAYTIGGEVGRVDAINNSEIFLLILFEYIIFKQKDDIVRKVITAIIAFSGVIILGSF